MKSAYILTAAAIATAAAVAARENVYIVPASNPGLVEGVPGVERVTFADETMRVEGLVSRSYAVDEVVSASFTDHGRAFAAVLPASIVDEYTFDIPWLSDLSTVSPVAEAVNPDSDDFLANVSFAKKLYINYSGTSATVSPAIEGVSVSISGADVTVTSETSGVEYVLSGTSACGSFKLYATARSLITLNGLDLKSVNRAAINIQNKKRNLVLLTPGTVNRLADSGVYTTAEGEDEKGCFFSEGKLCFNGSGALEVTANVKHGIVCDDYIHVADGVISATTSAVKASAIKAKDYYLQGGGYVQAAATADAGRALASDVLVNVTGGELRTFAAGGVILEEGKDDYTSASCVKCDGDIAISGGDVAALATGTGAKGLNAAADILIDGADTRVSVKTTGRRIPEVKEENDFTGPAASPKGIKAKGAITIADGTVRVNTVGGDGAEGVEAKGRLTLDGGSITAFCIDDVLNAGDGFFVNGGRVVGASLTNDGIDANYVYANGGYCFVVGADGDNTAFDTDGKTFYYNGGTLLGVGGAMNGVPDYRSELYSVNACIKGIYRYVTLRDDSDTDIIAMALPADYPVNKKGYNYGVLICSPLLKGATHYRLCGADSLSGGTETDGLITGATAQDPTTLYDFTTTEKNTVLQ